MIDKLLKGLGENASKRMNISSIDVFEHTYDPKPNKKSVVSSTGFDVPLISRIHYSELEPMASERLAEYYHPVPHEPETSPVSLASIFFDTCDQHGDHCITFIHAEDRYTMTYRELRSRVLRFGAALRHRGVGEKTPVLLQCDRVDNFVVSFWGCITAGCPPVPMRQIPLIQSHAEVRKMRNTWDLFGEPPVVTDESHKEPLIQLMSSWSKKQPRVFSVREMDGCGELKESPTVDPETTAMFLLTSGTTGQPKAVAYRHENILANIIPTVKWKGLTSSEVILNWMPLQHAGGLFSQHVLAVYLGCEQVLTEVDQFVTNPLNWVKWISDYKVTYTWAPNFAFSLLNRLDIQDPGKEWDLSSLRFLLSAGQPVSPDTMSAFFEKMRPLNLSPEAFCPQYGMTEASGPITFGEGIDPVLYVDKRSLDQRIREVPPEDPESVCFTDLGPPLPGLAVRIVDGKERVLPEGIIGRIQLRGPSIVSSYFAHSEENRPVFSEDGWFSTGDLGFLRPGKEGHLVITGREKDILIIRAKNHYNHEIEAIIESVEGVIPTFAAVGAAGCTTDGDDRLAIFFSPEDSDPVFSLHVAREISEQVRLHFGIAPDWIIPLSREEFPKTASGKIQRPLLIEALGEGKFAERHLRIDHFLSTGTLLTDSKARETYYEIRFNSEEKLDLLSLYRHMKRELMESGHWSGDIVLSQGVDRMENGELAVLWKDVLQQDTFVQGQNFFQLGGDSIKAMRLLAKVYETFGVEVTLRQFITDPTLEGLQALVERGGGERYTRSYTPRDCQTNPLPLTPSQRSQWFVFRNDPTSPVYTVTFTLRLRGELDSGRLSEAIRKIVEHHDVFRFRFSETAEGEPFQELSKRIFAETDVEDWRFKSEQSKYNELDALIHSWANQPFDLLSEELFRSKIIQMDEREHLLLVSVPHLIFDGWSNELFVQQLLQLCKPEVKESGNQGRELQFRDYVMSTLHLEEDPLFVAELEEWSQLLSRFPTTLDLPTDYPRPVHRSYRGRTLSRRLSPQFTRSILRCADRFGVTPYMLLVGLYASLLHRYSGQEQFLIGTVMSNRRAPEWQSTVGYLANTVPLPMDLSGDPALETFFARVREICVTAYDFQHIPLESVIRKMNIHVTPEISPLIQVMFTYQNELTLHRQYHGLDVQMSVVPSETSKYDLILHVYEEQDTFLLQLEYNTDLFRESTMSRFLDHYQLLVKGVVQN